MKITFTFFALAWCCQATAQQKYIEVTVSDTVLVKPDLFIYKIILSPDDDPTDFIGTRKGHQPVEEFYEQRGVKGRLRMDSLRVALKADGFDVYKSSLADSVNIIQPGMNYLTVNVMTHSVDSLGMLWRRLRVIKGVTGYIEAAVATQDSAFQEKLFRKILSRARAKAERIASLSALQVRGVLAVTEDKKADIDVGGWTSYPPLSGYTDFFASAWHTTISGPTKKVVGDPSEMGWYALSGTFTVRFWVE